MGTQGKVIALVSGGIDSPVAAWLMMKRGCTIVPLFLTVSHTLMIPEGSGQRPSSERSPCGRGVRSISQWCIRGPVE